MKKFKFFDKPDTSLFEEDVKIEEIDVEENDAFIDYSENDLLILGEGTEYEAIRLKKKRRRKKLLSFFEFLRKKQEHNVSYQINKIHFLEQLKVGKEKLGKTVTIPSVYVVEYGKKLGESKNKELQKYEIYDDETKKLIMQTDSNGNLVLTKEIAKLLGENSKSLGLEKEEKIRIRQINDMLWISSQSLTQKSIKEQQEKASISKIEQTLDIERERLRQNPILQKIERAKAELSKEGILTDILDSKDYNNIISVLSSDSYLTIDDTKTAIKIAQVSKDLTDEGVISSELTEKEMLKVKEKLEANPDASLKEVREAIQNEIGLERLPRKS